VSDAIAEKQAEVQRRTEITDDAVLEGLRREATAEHNSGATRVHAWTQLARALGMFHQTVEVKGSVLTGNSTLEQLTVEELKALAGLPPTPNDDSDVIEVDSKAVESPGTHRVRGIRRPESRAGDRSLPLPYEAPN